MKLDEPPTTLPFQKSKPEREVGTPCHWPSLPRSSMTCCSSLSFGVYTLRRQQASSSLKKSFSLSHGPFSSTSTERPAWARRSATGPPPAPLPTIGRAPWRERVGPYV